MASMKDVYSKITKGDKKPKKEISEIRTKKSHDGKYIHTHVHHRPEHHPDETHVSSNMEEMQKHMQDNEGAMTASPSPMGDNEAAEGEAPMAGAGPMPSM